MDGLDLSWPFDLNGRRRKGCIFELWCRCLWQDRGQTSIWKLFLGCSQVSATQALNETVSAITENVQKLEDDLKVEYRFEEHRL